MWTSDFAKRCDFNRRFPIFSKSPSPATATSIYCFHACVNTPLLVLVTLGRMTIEIVVYILRSLWVGHQTIRAQCYKRFFPCKYRSFPVFTGKKYRLQCYKHILPVFTGRIYRQNLQEDFSCNYRGFPVKQNFIDNRHVFLW